jgi:hypothetical protein
MPPSHRPTSKARKTAAPRSTRRSLPLADCPLIWTTPTLEGSLLYIDASGLRFCMFSCLLSTWTICSPFHSFLFYPSLDCRSLIRRHAKRNLFLPPSRSLLYSCRAYMYLTPWPWPRGAPESCNHSPVSPSLSIRVSIASSHAEQPLKLTSVDVPPAPHHHCLSAHWPRCLELKSSQIIRWSTTLHPTFTSASSEVPRRSDCSFGALAGSAEDEITLQLDARCYSFRTRRKHVLNQHLWARFVS